jgi:hypothetical protein
LSGWFRSSRAGQPVFFCIFRNGNP